MNYTSIPALASYIDRIEAVQLNFRRFMVKDRVGKYYVERAIIRIVDGSDIECSKEEYAPTDDERARIKEALLTCEFPKSIMAESEHGLTEKVLPKSELYVFYDRRTGHVIMAQERRETPDGKVYLPWSFWSDGEWRNMEPDGPLPFWKPKQRRNKNRHCRIMIHEGAKPASFVDGMLNDPLKAQEPWLHPWAEELKRYEHWGIIGGALAPHRANYQELRDEAPFGVIYVCDNDRPGMEALKKVSRTYGRSLKGVMFDTTFPPSWDMADDMPDKMFNDGHYIGRRLKDCMMPATLATELVEIEGVKKPVAMIVADFAREWVHSVKPEAFIHVDWPGEIYNAQEFNNKVRPFSTVDDTARLLKSDAVGKGAVIQYDPSQKPGIFNSSDGIRYINTHVPSPIAALKGDAAPWLEFLEHMFPIESDRIEAIRWIVTLVSRPGIRMSYGMLLISEVQGVGKSTLGEKILTPLLGKRNCSTPNDDDICDSNYNYWLVHKRLAVIHEIYAGQSQKPYTKLQKVITETTQTVKAKYLANYEIECWIHILACSNSMKALYLPDTDRRWFLPTVTEETKDHEYWRGFNEWLSGRGLPTIRWLCDQWVKVHHPVMPGANAPSSSMKAEVIEEALSPGLKIVSDVLTMVQNEEPDVLSRFYVKKSDEAIRCREASGVTGARYVIPDAELVDVINTVLYDGRGSDKLEKPMTVRKLAKQRFKMESTKDRSYSKGRRVKLVCSHKEDARKSAAELDTVHLDVWAYYKTMIDM